MTDVAREKFMRLMSEIDDLEERAEELQQGRTPSGESPGPPDQAAARQELEQLLARLEEKRTELTRLSNACRRPHPNP